MNDTNEQVQRIYDSMIAQLPHEQRAQMGCSMHDFAKEIILSQIDLLGKSRAEVMEELFIRFYGNEYRGEILCAVLLAIRHHHSSTKGPSR